METGRPINRVLEKAVMATKTPHRSRGSRSRAASAKESRRVIRTPSMAATTMTPASSRLSWSRLFSSPVRQLQGTAILTMYLLINFFSEAFIQPRAPIK